MKTKLIGIIICMLLVGTILPVSGTSLIDKTTTCNVSGNTLYVGGTGEGNYTFIQDAINDSVDGDTVYVYDDSSPYVENLIVDKSINLIGEDKHTTVIDGNNNEEGEGDVIHIKADGVTIQGFTIQNCSHFGSQENYFCGIEIRSNYNLMKDNIITNNYHGIQIGSIPDIYSNSNVIEDNIIINNKWGVILLVGSDNLVSRNFISLNDEGIKISFYGYNNLVILNNISLNDYGININGVKNITIKRNTIFNNIGGGVFIEFSSYINVLENNIFNNDRRDAFIVSLLIFLRSEWMENKFDGNYWGKEGRLPILIPGVIVFLFGSLLTDFFGFEEPLYFNFYKVDWNPAQEPYDI